MALPPISPTSVGELGTLGVQPLPTSTVASSPGPDDSSSFGDMLTNALDAVSASHDRADALALQAATGDLNAVHDYTIAATEAQLLTQLTVEVRNRAVDAFNEIMRMQV